MTSYQLIPLGLAITAAVLCLLAIRLLLSRGWLLPWLRGTAGLLLLLGTVALVFTAVELRDFDLVESGQPVITVTVVKTSEQQYQLVVDGTDKEEQRFPLEGDTWQLTVNVLNWQLPNHLSRNFSAYQLLLLNSRYDSLEQQLQMQPQPHSLVDDVTWLSGSNWLQQLSVSLKFVELKQQTVKYIPLVDAALYGLYITDGQLLVRALNEPARQVLPDQSTDD